MSSRLCIRKARSVRWNAAHIHRTSSSRPTIVPTLVLLSSKHFKVSLQATVFDITSHNPSLARIMKSSSSDLAVMVISGSHITSGLRSVCPVSIVHCLMRCNTLSISTKHILKKNQLVIEMNNLSKKVKLVFMLFYFGIN